MTTPSPFFSETHPGEKTGRFRFSGPDAADHRDAYLAALLRIAPASFVIQDYKMGLMGPAEAPRCYREAVVSIQDYPALIEAIRTLRG